MLDIQWKMRAGDFGMAPVQEDAAVKMMEKLAAAGEEAAGYMEKYRGRRRE